MVIPVSPTFKLNKTDLQHNLYYVIHLNFLNNYCLLKEMIIVEFYYFKRNHDRWHFNSSVRRIIHLVSCKCILQTYSFRRDIHDNIIFHSFAPVLERVIV